METFSLGNILQQRLELPKKVESRLVPVFEMARLFVDELNKTAGQPYTTKQGKKGKSIFYTEILVMKDLKKLGISKDVHKVSGFFGECEKSNLGFRFYYKCQIKIHGK